MNNKFKIMNQDSGQLLETIDFFAQNLSFEQIISYGYYFIHDMLKLEVSSIYVIDGSEFQLKSQMNGEFKTKSFSNDARMMRIATKFGRVMQKELPQYFDKEFLETEEIKLAMPILVKDQTVGIIFSRNDNIDMTEPELALFFNGINQLINKASESAKNFEQFKDANAALDRKIFNLLFINHSTKALMSEIEIERLYQLCIDVIRELTASSVTSFGLYDKVRQTIVLKGYKDILSFDEYYCEIDLKVDVEKTSKVVYHIEEDYHLLEKIFVNPEEFLNLKAKYVVLLIKDQILGFVTIGETVSSRVYTKELLAQTESLVSSIYIAITNAQYFHTIRMQKEEISKQLEMMNQLNSAIKNINTSDTVDELCHIALQTLALGFGIKKSMIVLKSKEGYLIESVHGFSSEASTFSPNELFKSTCYDQTYFEPLVGSSDKFIESALLNEIGESNCFVSVPLETGEMSVSSEPQGFLMLFETESALRNSQIVILETLSNSISPTIKQMNERMTVQTHYMPNQENVFIGKLNEAIVNRDDYYTDFTVYFKRIETVPFTEVDLSAYTGMEVQCFSNVVLHIAYNNDFDEDLFEGKLEVFNIESFIEELKMVL